MASTAKILVANFPLLKYFDAKIFGFAYEFVKCLQTRLATFSFAVALIGIENPFYEKLFIVLKKQHCNITVNHMRKKNFANLCQVESRMAANNYSIMM